MNNLCPTPSKKRYLTEERAEQALHDPRLGRTLYSPIRVYPCQCGGWHLTAQPQGHRPQKRSKKNRRR
ncbi:hypothetical protein SEA_SCOOBYDOOBYDOO_136 [Mycobacterium phage ScoobyDoobyDoo]|nr:hypothetical protein SEA_SCOOBYDOOBYDOO_136 [Mycobacterium phage ScoobyDoobyDoo]